MEIKRALISVSDKTGIVEFARALHERGIELVSTGGSRKTLGEAGVPVIDISDFTGFPEIMGGRVKTLHPNVHGAILGIRDSAEHRKDMEKHSFHPIDMVVVNLYPFERVIQRDDVDLDEAIENIDIGGPSMIRSAAKNHRFVTVVTDPCQYREVLDYLRSGDNALPDEVRQRYAVRAFERTAEYDAAISGFLGKKFIPGAENRPLSDTYVLRLAKVRDVRYGENPHQNAAVYRNAADVQGGILDGRQIQGKQLSFNNFLDLDAAARLVSDFDEPAACVIKHLNPSGAACGATVEQAFRDALACDPLSAFGGIIGLNRPVNETCARLILKRAGFIECIIAPDFSPAARAVFQEKKNLRIISLPALTRAMRPDIEIKTVSGGFLIQQTDTAVCGTAQLRTVTKKKPGTKQIEALLFAWKVVKHVKSNAIVIGRGMKTVGIGAGQMSRVDSVVIACRKAAGLARNAVLASDAFFPKSDSILKARRAGITAIIQPGGSIKDHEVIAACDRAGIAMVFTGTRHFKH